MEIRAVEGGKRTKRKFAYRIDLTKIDGSGEVLCPRCGTAISPDDVTEEAYSILGTKVDSRGLEELLIRCNRCESQIDLTGFSFLNDFDLAEEKTPATI